MISPANTSSRNARPTCTPRTYLPRAEQHRFSRIATLSARGGAGIGASHGTAGLPPNRSRDTERRGLAVHQISAWPSIVSSLGGAGDPRRCRTIRGRMVALPSGYTSIRSVSSTPFCVGWALSITPAIRSAWERSACSGCPISSLSVKSLSDSTGIAARLRGSTVAQRDRGNFAQQHQDGRRRLWCRKHIRAVTAASSL